MLSTKSVKKNEAFKSAILEVFHVMEGRGIMTGEFTAHLIETISRSDNENKEKLAKIYPEYVEAVRAYEGYEITYDEAFANFFKD